ncbi:Receptor-interacting serine/threonine-protein kinase 2 [Tulasnella sp. 408]|nr:Receptor-interacting serine/threonine-protein kinase 2 [Tulasnella sp. 408]
MGDLDPKEVLKCHGYRFGNKPFMILDFDGKEPLSLSIEQSDLNPMEKLRLLYETGKAIQYLHCRSPPVAHGAVHPKNILIATPDSAVLSDFGLANVWRILEPDDTDHGWAFEIYDTWRDPRDKVGYTAPEYILCDTGEMLPPADIYAFASVILAGIALITQGVPPDPEDYPNLPENDSLWPLLQRMWSQNPADRPTIDDVLKQLDQELRIRGGENVPDIIALEHVVARSHL